VDHDGVVHVKDFELVGERFIKAASMTEEQQKETRNGFAGAYTKYFHADKSSMTAKDFEECWRKLGTEGIKQICADFFPNFFQVVSKEHPGKITPKEFVVFHGFYGIDEKTAKESFKHLDTNHDGLITKEEFITYAENFHLLDKEGDPSQHYFGPLS